MNRLTIRLFGSVIVLLPIVMGVVLYQQSTNRPLDTNTAIQEPIELAAQPATVESGEQPPSILPTPTLMPPPGTLIATPVRPHIWVTPEVSPIQWSEPPLCKNQPLTVAEWKQKARDEIGRGEQTVELLLARAQQLSPSLQQVGNTSQLINILLEEDGNNDEKGFVQDKVGLWLNIVAGFLNRETEIQLDTMPSVKKVKEVTQLGEQATGKVEESRQFRQIVAGLFTDNAITNAVCANLRIFQSNMQLNSVIWSAQGIKQEVKDLGALRPDSHWLLGAMFRAPNEKLIAIESYAQDTGGPIFLYDPETNTLLNLNQELKQNYKAMNDPEQIVSRESEMWSVLGWRSDSNYLFLTVDTGSFVIGVDLQDKIYERIDLDATIMSTSKPSTIDLMPEGTSWAYVRWNREGVATTELKIFNLVDRTSRLLFSLPVEKGRIYNPVVSPLGNKIAFLIEIGGNEKPAQHALYLYDLATKGVNRLTPEDIGVADLAWSPDNKTIAFTWPADYVPDSYRLYPGRKDWHGNIWTVSTETRTLTQVTKLSGAAKHPFWSFNGNFITFFTQDAQIGGVAVDNPGNPWLLMDGNSSDARFGYLLFLQ